MDRLDLSGGKICNNALAGGDLERDLDLTPLIRVSDEVRAGARTLAPRGELDRRWRFEESVC